MSKERSCSLLDARDSTVGSSSSHVVWQSIYRAISLLRTQEIIGSRCLRRMESSSARLEPGVVELDS
ncbi:hypothetical protein OESDEN_24812 [Oesophagostomum dentatum]|uniref:Uncharacterized protein n=1 Tax=Oesophagostomum dentatum TaxID=61180 RepID=A0A0B1RWN0_OESDE|nr:hypothetical protein OESDEN_24812 [Oesophagostomum dentatum]